MLEGPLAAGGGRRRRGGLHGAAVFVDAHGAVVQGACGVAGLPLHARDDGVEGRIALDLGGAAGPVIRGSALGAPTTERRRCATKPAITRRSRRGTGIFAAPGAGRRAENGRRPAERWMRGGCTG